VIKAYFGGPSYSTMSYTGMCYSLPSTISARLGAISNATARSRHYADDVVRRSTGRVAELGRLSALPIVEQQLTGMLDVVEAT